eukprot:1483776-Prymnesium_polylepis.1
MRRQVSSSRWTPGRVALVIGVICRVGHGAGAYLWHDSRRQSEHCPRHGVHGDDSTAATGWQGVSRGSGVHQVDAVDCSVCRV